MTWGQLRLQDGLCPIIEEIIFFHDQALVVLRLILGVVGTAMVASCVSPSVNLGLLEGQAVEGV